MTRSSGPTDGKPRMKLPEHRVSRQCRGPACSGTRRRRPAPRRRPV